MSFHHTALVPGASEGSAKAYDRKPGGASILGRIVDGLVSAVTTVRNRRVVSRLTDLDDTMLADIGLTRADVHKALDTPFWMDASQVLNRSVTTRENARLWGATFIGR